MKTLYEKFRVKPGKKVSLAGYNPDYTFNFKPDDREARVLQPPDDFRERLVFPRIGKPRKVGIHLYDDVRYPHLRT